MNRGINDGGDLPPELLTVHVDILHSFIIGLAHCQGLTPSSYILVGKFRVDVTFH